jgi:hypothetical protein
MNPLADAWGYEDCPPGRLERRLQANRLSQQEIVAAHRMKNNSY